MAKNNVIKECTFTIKFKKDDVVVTINAVDLTTAISEALRGRSGQDAIIKSVTMDKEGIDTVIPVGTYTDQ